MVCLDGTDPWWLRRVRSRVDVNLHGRGHGDALVCGHSTDVTSRVLRAGATDHQETIGVDDDVVRQGYGVILGPGDGRRSDLIRLTVQTDLIPGGSVVVVWVDVHRRVGGLRDWGFTTANVDGDRVVSGAMRILGSTTVLSLVFLGNVWQTELAAVGSDSLRETSSIGALPVDFRGRGSSDIADDLNVLTLVSVDDLWGNTDGRNGGLFWRERERRGSNKALFLGNLKRC